MSRSGYVDDSDDQWALICWRGAVRSALTGFRGQAALKVLRDALDTMPNKRLIANSLINDAGECCTLGRLAQACDARVEGIDPYDHEAVSAALGLAPAMVREIAYENDYYEYRKESPEDRWKRMRSWVDSQIAK